MKGKHTFFSLLHNLHVLEWNINGLNTDRHEIDMQICEVFETDELSRVRVAKKGRMWLGYVDWGI